MLCKMLLRLRPEPSCSWLVTHLRIYGISLPETHFLSTAAIESCIDDGGDNRNPTEKAELTGTLLGRYGFSNAQISKVRTSFPQIFNSVHTEKTLLPKLEFFRGIGFSDTDLPRFICSNPALLGYSLQNQIVPLYSFIKGLLLSDDSDDDEDEIVLKILKRNTRLLGYSLEDRIVPSISALREAGVPQKQILYLLRRAPTVLGCSSLGESIKRATEMGFQPNKTSFVDAIQMFTEMSRSTWDKKMEVYRKCGFSDEDILKAFMLYPTCMALAEENIVKTADFVLKKMGWPLVVVVRNPNVLAYSLEKRTIPRCTVVQYLQGKGLLRKTISLNTFLRMKEKDFMDKFVKKYEDDVPGLMDIYLASKIIPPPQEPTP